MSKARKPLDINKLPLRMGKGKFWTGPEFAGCCGTGLRPQIRNSEFVKIWSNGEKRFAVGPELRVDEAILALRREAFAKNGKQYFKWPSSWSQPGTSKPCVRFFKTFAPAKALFIAECQKVIAYNAAESATVNAARQQLLVGTPEQKLQAANVLFDH